MLEPLNYRVSEKSSAARRFYKRASEPTQHVIRDAIQKICDNPFQDHRRHAIRALRAEWEGYREYRLRRPLLRIIYQTDRRNQLLFIEEILPHLP